ncbi:hypothetical protein [Agrobacterium vaccinii]|uniref:hypothetical protein n=1 Tax=Agrobacterium vaccinii TaxID=2735528 RepID=UPI001E4DAC26|nr:hypothetical protein [Agrobacterium vaccinii]
MSYDLMVFESKDAPKDKEAFLDWYHVQTQWSEGHSYDDPSATTTNLSAWYEDVRLSFPNLNGPDAYEFADDDDNPNVTEYSIGRSVIYASFRWSEAETAYAVVRAMAVKHGVGFFNVSAEDGEIWFPPTEHTSDITGILDFTLSLEGQQAFKAPSLALIEAAVDWLQPNRGTGFLLLSKDSGGDYAQVGGGNEFCAVEWREYSNGSFRHWVAGLPDHDAETNISIPGNGTYFLVEANERLSNDNVKVILRAFADDKPKPQDFVWRDITVKFNAASSSNASKPWWQFWR